MPVVGGEPDFKIFELIRKFDFNNANLFVTKSLDYKPKERAVWFYFIQAQRDIAVNKEEPPSYLGEDLVLKIITDLNLGFFEFLEKGNELRAYQHFKTGLAKATKINHPYLVCEAIKAILELYDNYDQPLEDVSYKYFLKLYRDFAFDDYEELLCEFYTYRLELRYNLFEVDTKILYKKTNLLAAKFNNRSLNLDLHTTNASYHYHVNKNVDSAFFFLDKVLRESQFSKTNKDFRNQMAATINKSKYLALENEPHRALQLLNSIHIVQEGYLWTLAKTYWYNSKRVIFEQLNQKDSMYFYENLGFKTQLNLQQNRSLEAIAELETKYQTAEKEKQILVEKQRATTNRNWLIVATLALIFGTGIAILIQKNTTKKRKLAEQEALIEQQKVTTLLKEQELVSIDAMIEGQEKERTKVANELHDDLGSLMATVKLHFDNVKVDKKDPALKNAQKLLEEAYQKIRGIAHSKNSGVMADQGLLPAVKKMARTITETNALEVTVEDFGLGERLENSLELTIFRIIQELAANIIKHSGATKASIQFTQHDAVLNIIVEDNGKGFDMSATKRRNKGMGLGTIEKRIEHLEGTFTVDSVLGKGTSILIDIPV